MEIAAQLVILSSVLLLSALGLHNKVPALHVQKSTGSFHHKMPLKFHLRAQIFWEGIPPDPYATPADCALHNQLYIILCYLIQRAPLLFIIMSPRSPNFSWCPW